MANVNVEPVPQVTVGVGNADAGKGVEVAKKTSFKAKLHA